MGYAGISGLATKTETLKPRKKDHCPKDILSTNDIGEMAFAIRYGGV